MADGGPRQAVHKSGPLKQQNKPHKTGKHRTKGQIAATFKGESFPRPLVARALEFFLSGRVQVGRR